MYIGLIWWLRGKGDSNEESNKTRITSKKRVENSRIVESVIAGLAMTGMSRRNTLSKEAEKDAVIPVLAGRE